MSPDKHYEAAEQHLTWAQEGPQHTETEKYHLDAAQVHALLAVAGFQAAANEHAARQTDAVSVFVGGAIGNVHPDYRPTIRMESDS